MKLLFDENLSPRLPSLLRETYPEASHVRDVGLRGRDDTAIWRFARDNGYTIVTKDSDFHHRALLLGPPPRIVWLRLGNRSTADVVEILTSALPAVREFLESRDAAILALD